MASDIPVPPSPVECRRCGRMTAIAITRGLPGPGLRAAIEAGRVEHRGYMVGDDDDDWTCRACGYAWQDRG